MLVVHMQSNSKFLIPNLFIHKSKRFKTTSFTYLHESLLIKHFYLHTEYVFT